MAEITWRNVGGTEVSSAATAGLANGVETVMNAFDPLEEMLKGRAAREETNWKAGADKNTRDMEAQVQNVNTLKQLNQMQDEGALSKASFDDRFGIQYNPENRQKVIDQRRAELQGRVANELLPTALAAADKESDLLAGNSILEKGYRDAGMREEEIQSRLSSFNKNNEARQALYGKAKKENLISAMADVDFDEHSTVDDITDILAGWQDAGLNVDYDAAQDALDRKRIGARNDWSQEKKIEAYNHSVNQRELRKQVSSQALSDFKSSGGDMASVTENILKSGLDNPTEVLANMTPALAKMADIPATEKFKIQMQMQTEEAGRNEIKTEQDALIKGQQKQIDGMLAFPSERLEYLKNNIKNEQDIYASHDFKNSHIDKNNIQEGMEVLQSKKVKLGAQDAAIVMAMTLEQVKGNDKSWFLPDALNRSVENRFQDKLTQNAIQYKKWEGAQGALNKLGAGFAKEQRQWKRNHDALTGARLLSASQSKLKGQKVTPDSLIKDFDIDPDLGMSFSSGSDERVLDYMESYNEIMNPGGSKKTKRTSKPSNSNSKPTNRKESLPPVMGKNTLEQVEDFKKIPGQLKDLGKHVVIPALQTTQNLLLEQPWEASKNLGNMMIQPGIENFRKTINKNLESK